MQFAIAYFQSNFMQNWRHNLSYISQLFSLQNVKFLFFFFCFFFGGGGGGGGGGEGGGRLGLDRTVAVCPGH